MSSFGYLASGLAGQPTYLMNIAKWERYGVSSDWRTNGKAVCEKAWAAGEGCQLFPITNLTCSTDPRGNGERGVKEIHTKSDPGKWISHIRHCQDQSSGLTVVPRFKLKRPQRG